MIVLIDFDPKGMSEAARQQFNEYGGLIGALCEVVPVLETTALVKRSSTSSALRNAETGEFYLHSGGEHIVIPVIDAADIPRFLSDLHARSWLAGLGWGIVSGCGSFLERSIVDKSCGSPWKVGSLKVPRSLSRPLFRRRGKQLHTMERCSTLDSARHLPTMSLLNCKSL